MDRYLWLIPALPLAGFLANAFLRLPKPAAAGVACAGPLASFALSVLAALKPGAAQAVFPWITVGDLTIPFGLQADALTSVMILVVTGVGSLIHIYSIGYM
jgi:NADH-quinone oxidoreductase subunit L